MTTATPNPPSVPCAPFTALRGLADRLGAYDAELAKLAGSDERSIARQARRLQRQMRDFEPAVTFFGQVKAGKTTLVNALAGWPGLLPADVNPWTSVVTSLHLSPQGGSVTDARRSGSLATMNGTRCCARAGAWANLPRARAPRTNWKRCARSLNGCAPSPAPGWGAGSRCCWGKPMNTTVSTPS